MSSPGAEKDVIRSMRDQLGLDAGTAALLSSAAAADLVKLYFAGAYTGAAFNVYGHNDPCAITSDDLIAVTMLSISIRENSNSAMRPSAILKLHAHSDEIEQLLTLLPPARELHTLTAEQFDTWLGPNSPGTRLYNVLRHSISFPRVTTHKLLARKRPLLMPIRDTVVEGALNLGNRDDDWWRPWWLALSTDEALVSRLGEIRRLAGRPDLSLLRIADIVIWLQNWAGREPLPSSPV
jgi:hypothetical protein